MFPLKILYIGEHETIVYAAEELKKYLERMGDNEVFLIQRDGFRSEEDDGIWLGVSDSFSHVKAPKVEEPQMDDGVLIEVTGSKGVITGVNPRSVLLAVYRYLTELGCRWVRPGADGEFVPKADICKSHIQITEAASYRHRGICIEGAVSYENVRDIIEWAPKVGLNGYYIQFREAYTFFERWYLHFNNPLKEPEEFSVETAKKLVAMVVQEITKRDLIYHGVGHGWTCEPLGLPGLGWTPMETEPSPEISKYLALVNGERKLWGGITLNTNLCYSNPEVHRLVIQEIVDYAQEHSEIDILHFWLADGSNNQCECDCCKDTRPSDFYVDMLNEVDKLLTERGLKTKIVFLIYVDLLWPPVETRINNPDRFILMFAPITRTYTRPFIPGDELPKIPPYKRNQLRFPKSVEENIAFLRQWQAIFKGDSFDFDYHYMWDHYNDPGYTEIARVLHKDIKRLKDIGLNGYVSCQTQRAFFPTGLGMVVMGWTLWNHELSFEDMAQDYFSAAFGPYGDEVYSYLKELSRHFCPPYLRGEKPQISEEAAKRFKEIPKLIEDFKPIIEKNLDSKERCWNSSWSYLKEHALFCVLYSQTLAARAQGNKDKSAKLWKNLEIVMQEREDMIQSVFDVWLIIHVLRPRLVP